MKTTIALLLAAGRVSRRLVHFFAAGTVLRRGALLAALALPCFSGQGGTAADSAAQAGIASSASGARTNAPPVLLVAARDTDHALAAGNPGTNIFLGMAGIYSGLFSSAEIGAATDETAGEIANLTLNSRGSYSGTVYLGGSSGFGISGHFTPNGYATNVVTNGLDGHVKVELQVNGNSKPRTITGSVIGTNRIVVRGTNQTGWISQVALIASLTNTSHFAPAYTLLIPPAADSNGTNSPAGCSYGLLTNSPGSTAPATVFFRGLLADWASIGTAMPIREDNEIAVYLNYYNTPQPGMLYGMLNLVSNPPFVPSGSLTWIRKAGSTGLFTNGFTNYYPAVPISPWSNLVPINRVITSNQLVLSGGGLTAPLTYSVRLNGTNLVLTGTGGTTNHASGSVNTNNGRLKFTFTNDVKKTVTGKGAILQNTSVSDMLGGGFFIVGPQAAPTNSGSIVLQLPAP